MSKKTTIHHEPPTSQLKDMGVSPMLAGVQIVLTRQEHAIYHLVRYRLYEDPDDLDAYKGQIGQLDAQGRVEFEKLLNQVELLNFVESDIKARAINMFRSGKIGS